MFNNFIPLILDIEFKLYFINTLYYNKLLILNTRLYLLL
jgi:hypothetical protein